MTQTIVITATFTAEPLQQSLRFWISELEFRTQITFAPYNQVFQQLLDPKSIISTNKSGLNVVLVRLEDWWRDDDKAEFGSPNGAETGKRNVSEFLAALNTARLCSDVPLLVCLCPPSESVRRNRLAADRVQQLENQIAQAVRPLFGVYVVASEELALSYLVEDYEDREADEVGHVPYTEDFFNALGTMIARRLYRLYTPPHKVIVLDCDDTLWEGTCGEVGAEVTVNSSSRALQELLINQHDAGMLICLCSKNEEEDVRIAFEGNSGMLLKWKHLSKWRINWLPKSQNLRSLAEELQIGLDSFIFIDDSAAECAEILELCPGVLVLQLPRSDDRIQFLSHVWAFDHLEVTREDERRNAFYGESANRELLRTHSSSISEFLSNLQLQVEIAPMLRRDVSRVSQLTYRTNQFNSTTIRRSEAEIASLDRVGTLKFLVVRVRDRFGDYGLVGLIAYSMGDSAIDVSALILSCRALGRGVEHVMLAHLTALARAQSRNRVHIKYIPTTRNRLVREFLESVDAGLEADRGHSVYIYRACSDPNPLASTC